MNLSTTRSLRSLENAEPTEEENSLTGKIIGAAIDVHRILGPGLLESAYEACLVYELRLWRLKIESQKAIPVFYKDVMLDCGYRVDLLVEDQVIVEIKSVAGMCAKEYVVSKFNFFSVRSALSSERSERVVKKYFSRFLKFIEYSLWFIYNK